MIGFHVDVAAGIEGPPGPPGYWGPPGQEGGSKRTLLSKVSYFVYVLLSLPA